MNALKITSAILRIQYDEQELIERARIAYAKAGSADQPGNGSDVTEIDGAPHVALRNVNGLLAVYRFDGEALKRTQTAGELAGFDQVDREASCVISRPQIGDGKAPAMGLFSFDKMARDGFT